MAARTFLGNLRSIGEKLQPDAKDPWFVQISWLQYCTGLNCSDLLLKDTSVSTRVGASVLFRENELAVGRRCVGEGSAGHGPAEWVWWAVRVNLERHPKPRQEGLAKLLGKDLVSSERQLPFGDLSLAMYPSPRSRPCYRAMTRASTEETLLDGGMTLCGETERYSFTYFGSDRGAATPGPPAVGADIGGPTNSIRLDRIPPKTG